MDSTCYKCGAAIHEGVPFCPACGAPQIRVTVPEASSPETPVFAPGTPAEMQPPAQPVVIGPSSLIPGAIDWHAARSAILIAGLVTGFLSHLPLGILWVFGGGALAVNLYNRKQSYLRKAGASQGAKLGAITGMLSYAVFAVLAGIQFYADPSKVRETFAAQIQKAAATATDARVREMYQQFLTPEGLALFLTLIMAILFVFFLGLSSVGGAVGAAFFRRRGSRD